MDGTGRTPLSAVDLSALPIGGRDRAVLVDSPAILIGIKTYAPGEVFGNHFHRGYDEFFAVLDGEITVWTGRSTRHVLPAGTTLLAARGDHHYLVNRGAHPCRLLYAKVPPVEDDTEWVDWQPEAGAA